MVKEFDRSLRIAQEIKKKITIILQRKIDDPRLKMITTVSSVEVSRDLSYAKVFVTFFKAKHDLYTIKNGMKALKASSKYIRVLLKQNMKLRIIPIISFSYDSSLKKGEYICNIINQLYDKKEN
ncbi:30S ribosome-binding factor RbfA [Pantoea sp. SoEX]|uniref:30S ribosome-binding factor RbfA n=1 Tax=Pantoea sp. SoEX TaxID=2576763 RepID=UPI00135AA5F0|nr:30S ribosome-binding factor RbfA [Pantoea sp. SoEX]MXP51101.1 30S ribosome-binding factor RbfA [Pantoea sp. SoEX]